MCNLIFRVLVFSFLITNCYAHAEHGESGFMHPLTGIDHMTAMIAVGAWSAQLGGKAILRVPATFVGAMLLGGIIGFNQIIIPYTEVGIILSVILLGLAIALEHKLSLVFAATGVAIFGICHGYAHGMEIPQLTNKVIYTLGFLITTASLHLVGAVGGILLLEKPQGQIILRALGGVTFLIGIYLLT